MSKKSTLFARLSLDYADHPKIMSLSDAAFRAHVSFILYCRKYETDGIIKNPVANRLALQWDSDVLAELENNDENSPSLQKLENGDYYLTGYADMQETRAEIEERRTRNSRNGAKGGRPRKETRTQTKTKNETQWVTDSQTEPQTRSGTQEKAETETETELIPKGINVSDSSTEEPRRDVETILNRIDEHCHNHGFKKPSRSKANTTAARLLLDKDEYTTEQVTWIIDWVSHSDFWAPNIRSASKLREKFDQLKGQAQRNHPASQHTGIAPGTQRAMETLNIGARLQAEYEDQQKANQ